MKTFTPPLAGEARSHRVIETTLYDLIEAINAVLRPGEEDLVVPTVMRLLDRSQVTYSHRSASYN